ncbi:MULTISPECIES: sigma-54 dependent transcriptional regulator [unclassified Bacillus (in: firmicutes)]|uniref:sigma-54-dependent transcriptional regulator n=1 Tax=unclassified Bacillus (in: firmicutes) TaxID=185979 RepID=UPI001BE8CE06|nr:MULTISPECIES: sigma-54 dependent transcriptional regulator [unclassified Bacillus (in: firmicutes)]MBT2617476.1 sigma-54-dependent Fis family transcriptional regulator [Bacillus sp. ISL-78]MBT2630832.1 sigma-54-dependent Fis family transcriptional regulator [Bacillus sp. ISL-101]
MTVTWNVLIVDDEAQLCKLVARKLQKAQLRTFIANNGQDALHIINKTKIDAVILDYMLPDMTGIDVLKVIKKDKDIPVIMLTAYGNVESAVLAMKLGAADYLNKPIELEELKNIVLKVCQQPRGESDVRLSVQGFVSQSGKMNKVMELVQRVKDTEASILILGESGVGKTALAKWIHENSIRKDKPFVAINCAAIPETLLESELFGFRKGSFTGATSSQKGKFMAADGGTIFLDEIGEISLGMQVKLLHVIEEKKIMQLGSNEYHSMDVRIIAATNKNLKKLVQEQKFREDLYYRLNLMEVEIPPLRDRKEDIGPLVNHHIEKLNQKYKKQLTIHPEVVQQLASHFWPGNIRELLNTVERIHILNRIGTIEVADLEYTFTNQQLAHDKPSLHNEQKTISNNLSQALEEVEEQMIKKALTETNDNQTKAAEKLGIARHTLIYKMKKMGIKP